MEKQKLVQAKANKPKRTSVSAEIYGQFNKKGQFQAQKVNKSEDGIKRIQQRMSQAYMFSTLDENELSIVIDAMEEKKFKAGNFVIKQGDDGKPKNIQKFINLKNHLVNWLYYTMYQELHLLKPKLMLFVSLQIEKHLIILLKVLLLKKEKNMKNFLVKLNF